MTAALDLVSRADWPAPLTSAELRTLVALIDGPAYLAPSAALSSLCGRGMVRAESVGGRERWRITVVGKRAVRA